VPTSEEPRPAAGAAEPLAAAEVMDQIVILLRNALPELTAEVVARIRQEQESYEDIARDQLEISVRRNLDIAVRALQRGAPPSGDDLREAEATTRERFAARIPVEEIIRAFRICIGAIHDRFVRVCVAEGLPTAVSLSGSNVLWAVGDVFTTKVITEYRSLDLEQALQDAQRRTSHVRRLLRGESGAEEMARLRLDPGSEYAAIWCAADPGKAERTRRVLEASGSLPGRPAVLALDDEHCIGVVARRPQAGPGQVVGLGPFVPLARIARSYEVAGRAATIATGLHRTGVQGVEELTWRLAAAEHGEVGRLLWHRCLEPLRREGRFGTEIEESVRTYLAAGRSIPRAAHELVLHVNTLRYRLRRFTELTGLHLDDPDDLVQVVWALEFSGFADPGDKL
jgi:hypothetical protein